MCDALLYRLHNVRLERAEVVLDIQHVLSVGVFLLDLLVQAIRDTFVKDERVVVGFDASCYRVIAGSVLSQQFNVLLSSVASLFYYLACLSDSLVKLLAFRLDLGVQALEDG